MSPKDEPYLVVVGELSILFVNSSGARLLFFLYSCCLSLSNRQPLLERVDVDRDAFSRNTRAELGSVGGPSGIRDILILLVIRGLASRCDARSRVRRDLMVHEEERVSAWESNAPKQHDPN